MTYGPPSSWTDERIELLKSLWLAGHSCSQIANALGGITRNAVIGKVTRLGLSAKGRAVRQTAARPKPATVKAPAPPRTPAPPRSVGALALKADVGAIRAEHAPVPQLRVVVSNAEPVALLDLEPHHCRYVLEKAADDGSMLFCGQTKKPGGTFCADHAAICFTPAKPRPLKPFYERSRYERPINSVREL